MKKILSILGIISMSSSIISSSSIKPNLGTSSTLQTTNEQRNIQNRNDQRVRLSIKDFVKTIVGKKALKLPDNIQLTDLTTDPKPGGLIIFPKIKAALLDLLEANNFDASKIEIIKEQTPLIKPIITSSQVSLGRVLIKIAYKNVLVSNDNGQIFIIEYGTPFLIQSQQIFAKLNNGEPSKLSSLKLSSLGMLGANGQILETIFNLLQNVGPKILNNLPTKIPESFDSKDPDWAKWNIFVSEVWELIKFKMPVQTLDDNYHDMTFGPYDASGWGIKINVKINFKAVINGLLPTIINFRNYINEQKKQGIDNLSLLLIKYLYSSCHSYNNDGYAKINPGNYEQNNLDMLLHNLIDGWANKNKEYYTNLQPIKTQVVVSNIPVIKSIGINFKYKKDFWHWGIRDSAKMDKIIEFVNQLFNFDSNNETKFWATFRFWLAWGIIPFPIDLWFGIPIPINTLVSGVFTEDNLIGLLEGMDNEPILKNEISVKWEKEHSRKVIILYQTQNNKEWRKANNLDDLALATDMKLELHDNVITLINKKSSKPEEIKFTLAKPITLLLDLSSSPFDIK